jgi:ribosomal protein L6P/L9E
MFTPLKENKIFVFSKSLKNLNLEKLNFCIINNNRFFIYKNIKNSLRYLVIPNQIFFQKKNKILKLVFSAKKNSKPQKFYFYTFLNWTKNINKVYKRLLILRGLGLKVILSDDNKKITLKLGFSHLIVLNIPSNISKVTIKKNRLSLTSSNLQFLRQFAKKIKFFRKYNVYNGRGFAYRREIKKYKIFKKK